MTNGLRPRPQKFGRVQRAQECAKASRKKILESPLRPYEGRPRAQTLKFGLNRKRGGVTALPNLKREGLAQRSTSSPCSRRLSRKGGAVWRTHDTSRRCSTGQDDRSDSQGALSAQTLVKGQEYKLQLCWHASLYGTTFNGITVTRPLHWHAGPTV